MFILPYENAQEAKKSLELYLIKRSGTRLELSNEVLYGRIVHTLSCQVAYMSHMLPQIASAEMVFGQFGLKCNTLNRLSFSLEDSGFPGGNNLVATLGHGDASEVHRKLSLRGFARAAGVSNSEHWKIVLVRRVAGYVYQL